MSKKGVLLVNLGTPDSPKTSDVRKYLIEFLTDERVIDIPWFKRQLLVRLIIAPFRAKASGKLYKEIWDEQTGSPLMFHSLNLTKKVTEALPEMEIELAMRYQNPSIEEGIKKLIDKRVTEIIVLPLFPQYASASTGSVYQKVMDVIKKWEGIPPIRFIGGFSEHPIFIEAFVEEINKFDLNKYDHLLFSYHGLPVRQIHKTDVYNHCKLANECCSSLTATNNLCYRAQCYATTRKIVKQLGLDENFYSSCFQSRLGKEEWIQPYTPDALKKLASEGKKKILVCCPAFVADCLETIYEVSVEYDELFKELGGVGCTLVPSLNSSDKWVKAVVDMVNA